MAANAISGLGKPRDRFRGPGRALPEAPEGDSDETVSKNSAETSKTHETVSKMSGPEAKDDDSDETVNKNSAETSKTHETVIKMSDHRSKR